MSAIEYLSISQVDRRATATWLVMSAIALTFLLMIIGAPLSQADGHPLVALTIYQTFKHLCHQRPERSFFVAGHQFAVCARCTGLYVGFAVATFFYPLVRSLRRTDTPPRRWLFLSAAPLVIDFSLTFFGIWENTHLSRFLTGTLLGAVAVFYVMPGLIELALTPWRSFLGRRVDTGSA
jgi:uncharacterized membrane protein